MAYPANVNLLDFINYSCAPTLCYEPNYPRTEVSVSSRRSVICNYHATLMQSIRIGYLAEKIFLAGGLVTCGMLIMTHYVLPVRE